MFYEHICSSLINPVRVIITAIFLLRAKKPMKRINLRRTNAEVFNSLINVLSHF